MTIFSAWFFALGMFALVAVWSLIEIYLDFKKSESVEY